MIIVKTVRDLFKSNSLNQIIKYQANKEKELIQKDDDMKKLIIDKYPFLIKSLSNLEEIYSKIPNMEKLRNGFNINAEELNTIDNNENLFSFNFDDNETLNKLNDYLFEEIKDIKDKDNNDNDSNIDNDNYNIIIFDEDNLLNKINGNFFFYIYYYYYITI